MSFDSKDMWKMDLVSYTNTHHDVTDFVNRGMVKITKTWLSRENGISLFCEIKKFLTCVSDDKFGEVIVL